MDASKFKAPNRWPVDVQAFACEAISEIQKLKMVLKQAINDVVTIQGALDKAHEEIRELKTKLGTNSSKSHLPLSKNPPGEPTRDHKPSGQKQGAQKGHLGAGRRLFPSERIDHTRDIFSTQCPISGSSLRREELVSLSCKRFQQIDLPDTTPLVVTEFRLHACLSPCRCGKTVSALMPAETGNTVLGFRLKALVSLLATRYRLSKALVRELLVYAFRPEARHSFGDQQQSRARDTTPRHRSVAFPWLPIEAGSSIYRENAVRDRNAQATGAKHPGVPSAVAAGLPWRGPIATPC